MKMMTISAAAAGVAVTLLGCSTLTDTQAYKPISIVPEEGPIPKRVELDQAWTENTRMKFWFTSQGSRIIPYDWFTWLEQPDNQTYFRDSRHMESLRYLPMPSSRLNPAGLPVGFALDRDKKTGESWMGMTCSACHTNQIDYNGTKMLVEGAPTLGNFVLFYSRLVAALNETNKSDAKFERFARNVLAENYSESSAKALRERLVKVALAAAERETVNNLPDHYPEDFTSFARLDAFGNIQNAGTAFALHDLANRNAPTAPVSYPFLWGTHQSDVVQWNASAPNTPVVGPLVRNIGEVVGVFGELEIKEAPFWQRLWGKQTRYSSSVDMLALGHLESWVKTLRSPVWPQQYLPAIDTVKASQGALIYAKQCAGCHQVIPRAAEGEKYVSTKTPVEQVGTDPATAWNASFHMAKSLILEGEKSKILVGEKFKATTEAINVPVNGVVGIVLKDPMTALKAGLIPMGEEKHVGKKLITEMHLTQHLKDHLKARAALRKAKKSADKNLLGNSQQDLTGLVYKARPLNGIWATAPYLHNGSVASLWQLLKKPEERQTEFWVGSRTFDPKMVGFITNKGLSKFQVLSKNGEILPGNSNRGHSYGTQLSDTQKWALVEYMKTL